MARHGDVSHAGMNGFNPELGYPLPPPPPDVTHLEIYVRLKPPSQAVARNESGEDEAPSAKWDSLEARWKAILGLEATMDSFRISMESLLAEMEASLKKTLTMEEKLHAPRPRTWRSGARPKTAFIMPCRRCESLSIVPTGRWAPPKGNGWRNSTRTTFNLILPFSQMDNVMEQLEYLQKDRRTPTIRARRDGLSSNAKFRRECPGGLEDTAEPGRCECPRKRKGATGPKGKFFKSIRRWSGAD